jgi:hypothetical protein
VRCWIRFTLGTLLAAEWPGADCWAQDSSAVVFAYGVALQPPFVFSEMDGDTLLLNGLPFDPRRAPDRIREFIVKYQIDTLRANEADETGLTETEKYAIHTDLYDRARVAGSTERIEEIYRQSEHVEWVTVTESAVNVKFDFYEAARMWSRQSPSAIERPPILSRRELRQQLIDGFQRQIRSGALIAFGLDYSFVQRPAAAALTLALIQSHSAAGAADAPPHVQRLLEDIERNVRSEK